MQPHTADRLRAACAYATPRQRRLIAVEIGKAEAAAVVEGLIAIGTAFSAELVEQMADTVADHLADHVARRTAELMATGFSLGEALAYSEAFHAARDEALASRLPHGGAAP